MMNNDNGLIYRNNTWTLRVEYLTLLGNGKLFEAEKDHDVGKKEEVTDMYIYTSKGVEKVSINTTMKDKKIEPSKNKRYQYLKDKITNVLKNQEKLKQNINEEGNLTRVYSTRENASGIDDTSDSRDLFFFDKSKNEISIVSSKQRGDEERQDNNESEIPTMEVTNVITPGEEFTQENPLFNKYEEEPSNNQLATKFITKKSKKCYVDADITDTLFIRSHIDDIIKGKKEKSMNSQTNRETCNQEMSEWECRNEDECSNIATFRTSPLHNKGHSRRIYKREKAEEDYVRIEDASLIHNDINSYENTSRVMNNDRNGEEDNLSSQLDILTSEIKKIKSKMKIINNKKHGKINTLNNKINILNNKLNDNNMNNLCNDISIANNKIDILINEKINKIYEQIIIYVNNLHDQLRKKCKEGIYSQLNPQLQNQIYRQINNIKMQVVNLHEQMNNHAYMQRSNKMFNQMHNHINNLSNQIGNQLYNQEKIEIPCQVENREAPHSRRSTEDQYTGHVRRKTGRHRRKEMEKHAEMSEEKHIEMCAEGYTELRDKRYMEIHPYYQMGNHVERKTDEHAENQTEERPSAGYQHSRSDVPTQYDREYNSEKMFLNVKNINKLENNWHMSDGSYEMPSECHAHRYSHSSKENHPSKYENGYACEGEDFYMVDGGHRDGHNVSNNTDNSLCVNEGGSAPSDETYSVHSKESQSGTHEMKGGSVKENEKKRKREKKIDKSTYNHYEQKKKLMELFGVNRKKGKNMLSYDSYKGKQLPMTNHQTFFNSGGSENEGFVNCRDVCSEEQANCGSNGPQSSGNNERENWEDGHDPQPSGIDEHGDWEDGNDTKPSGKDADGPYNDQKLLYLKHKLIQLNLYKMKKKKKDEKDRENFVVVEEKDTSKDVDNDFTNVTDEKSSFLQKKKIDCRRGVNKLKIITQDEYNSGNVKSNRTGNRKTKNIKNGVLHKLSDNDHTYEQHDDGDYKQEADYTYLYENNKKNDSFFKKKDNIKKGNDFLSMFKKLVPKKDEIQNVEKNQRSDNAYAGCHMSYISDMSDMSDLSHLSDTSDTGDASHTDEKSAHPRYQKRSEQERGEHADTHADKHADTNVDTHADTHADAHAHQTGVFFLVKEGKKYSNKRESRPHIYTTHKDDQFVTPPQGNAPSYHEDEEPKEERQKGGEEEKGEEVDVVNSKLDMHLDKGKKENKAKEDVKNVQLTNSFTIDQIYNYTVNYYSNINEGRKQGHPTNASSNPPLKNSKDMSVIDDYGSNKEFVKESLKKKYNFLSAKK
ncbi:conserved Plasmodium protein, unknown function [Plasmodium ovale]|uniref:Uncharacterized protein n=1 Tax=Plasmodium ovale TaxID=36330 RepID=A0A1C3KXM2_PLAOA|nr:conserved Plasmodium protein, unknown function [Plasmodium ovale]